MKRGYEACNEHANGNNANFSSTRSSTMSKILSQLWTDEIGAIVSAEIVLIMTILVIGVIVGLKSLRDSIVTELADVAQALANLDQSFSFSGVSGHHAFTAGASFHDQVDF